jgi:hypothetical protein
MLQVGGVSKSAAKGLLHCTDTAHNYGATLITRV